MRGLSKAAATPNFTLGGRFSRRLVLLAAACCVYGVLREGLLRWWFLSSGAPGWAVLLQPVEDLFALVLVFAWSSASCG